MVGVKEEDVITEINGGNLNGEKDSDVNNSAAKRKDKIIDGKVLRRADGKKKKKKKRKPQTKLEAPSTPLTEIHSSSDNSTAKQEISAEDVKPENVEIEYVLSTVEILAIIINKVFNRGTSVNSFFIV